MVFQELPDDCLKQVAEHHPADVAPGLWQEIKNFLEKDCLWAVGTVGWSPCPKPAFPLSGHTLQKPASSLLRPPVLGKAVRWHPFCRRIQPSLSFAVIPHRKIRVDVPQASELEQHPSVWAVPPTKSMRCRCINLLAAPEQREPSVFWNDARLFSQARTRLGMGPKRL